MGRKNCRMLPILVVSISVQQENTQHIFRLLEAGAIDVCPKPRSGLVSEVSDHRVLSHALPGRLPMTRLASEAFCTGHRPAIPL